MGEPWIRVQDDGDLAAVLDLTRSAFGDEGAVVAAIVEELFTTPRYAAQGWVALDEAGEVVGHVALTPGWIDAVQELVRCPVLSPLSVRVDHQGRGLGGRLIDAALAGAEAQGAPAVVLEGDPAFYGRYGFEAGADRGLLAPSTAIPDAAFQWRRLPAYRPWMRGRFVYPDVFWRHDAVGLRSWRQERCHGVAVSTVTLGARDPWRLAQFYADLLGLTLSPEDGDDDWIALHDTGGWSIAIQHEPDQEPVVWPAGAGAQHMQVHLEIRADDLDAAVAHAMSCGAREATDQPQDDVRVMLDPEDHPFCLWVED